MVSTILAKDDGVPVQPSPIVIVSPILKLLPPVTSRMGDTTPLTSLTNTLEIF